MNRPRVSFSDDETLEPVSRCIECGDRRMLSNLRVLFIEEIIDGENVRRSEGGYCFRCALMRVAQIDAAGGRVVHIDRATGVSMMGRLRGVMAWLKRR